MTVTNIKELWIIILVVNVMKKNWFWLHFQWSMSRPLLGLILLNEKVSPQSLNCDQHQIVLFTFPSSLVSTYKI